MVVFLWEFFFRWNKKMSGFLIWEISIGCWVGIGKGCRIF